MYVDEMLNGQVRKILARIDKLEPRWKVVSLDHDHEEIHFESSAGIEGNLTFKNDHRAYGLIKIYEVQTRGCEAITICDGRVQPGTDNSLTILHDYIRKITMPVWRAKREAERDHAKEAKEKDARDRFFSN